MELIADILMIAATLAVAIYCIVLARRLSRFTDLEKGVGGAIAVLSAQVDDMTRTLTKAQRTAAGSAARLDELTERAEDVSRRLELLIASMHDLPNGGVPATGPAPEAEPGEALFLSQRSRVEAAE
ncbi:hypothetical protein [Celeribacter indicus]|uniref:Uncharacterized protein n=1 Tax=Celeribacter indicus TaxID=1208324 RepID=A0A0B5DNP6_9RHOB|nr:hypothetical protein [Celeribacter indicus]AJE44824.1 hypothetical protein P73_0109 [Celeribacter indicus]SDX24182.1 hypothetical protein SAMN05443573_11871 [Celeribacter indicus]